MWSGRVDLPMVNVGSGNTTIRVDVPDGGAIHAFRLQLSTDRILVWGNEDPYNHRETGPVGYGFAILPETTETCGFTTARAYHIRSNDERTSLESAEFGISTGGGPRLGGGDYEVWFWNWGALAPMTLYFLGDEDNETTESVRPQRLDRPGPVLYQWNGTGDVDRSYPFEAAASPAFLRGSGRVPLTFMGDWNMTIGLDQPGVCEASAKGNRALFGFGDAAPSGWTVGRGATGARMTLTTSPQSVEVPTQEWTWSMTALTFPEPTPDSSGARPPE